jgi:hypothetical protein
MAVSCPPKVELEHTQNKAQFGRIVRAVPGGLTASGISNREIGHPMLLRDYNRRDQRPGGFRLKIGCFGEVLLGKQDEDSRIMTGNKETRGKHCRLPPG